MRGFVAVALSCAALIGIGCTTTAKYHQKNTDNGIIELKPGADPKDAVKLIEQHIGKDYEMAIMPGTAGSVAAGSNFNPNATVQAGQTPTTPTYYQYSRKTPTGMTPRGLPPVQMDGMTQQAGFQPQRGNMPMAGIGNNAAMQPPGMPFGQ